MPSGKRLSKVQISEIFRLRDTGKTWDQIALQIGCGRSTVANYLHPEYYKRKRKRIRERARTPEWKANRVLTHLHSGSTHKVNKRPRPSECELCGSKAPRLAWHHWDDADLNKGLWLCFRCHMFAEGVDGGCGLEKYKELKEIIEKRGDPSARM